MDSRRTTASSALGWLGAGRFGGSTVLAVAAPSTLKEIIMLFVKLTEVNEHEGET